MIFGKIKISGHSMQPVLNPGDKVLISSIPYWFKSPKKEDVVLFEQNGKNLIKRIEKVGREKFYLTGDNKNDTLKIEPIDKNQILGKVITKI